MCACHLVNPARLSQPSRVGQGHLCPALEPSLPTCVSPWVTHSFLLCHLTSPPCYNEVSPVSILYNWCCLCLITKSFQPKCLCHHCPSLYYFPCPVPISCPTSIPTLHAFLMFIYSIFLSTYLPFESLCWQCEERQTLPLPIFSLVLLGARTVERIQLRILGSQV